VFNTDIKIQTNKQTNDAMINTKYENMEKKEYVSNKIVEKKKGKTTHGCTLTNIKLKIKNQFYSFSYNVFCYA